MSGTAYVFGRDNKAITLQVSNPECEIDGDAFWLWIEQGEARLNFEEWEGQAAACLKPLLQKHPELADVVVSDDSRAFDPGTKLSEVALEPALEMRAIETVEHWYHGTTTARLDAILEDGIRGDIPMDQRSWKIADVPQDQVYVADNPSLALDYAKRAAQRYGGDPVVLEISTAVLDAGAICEDRDFPLLDGSWAWKEGRYGDCSAASASLTLTNKVGYRGSIPPEAITAFLRTKDFVNWEREEPAPSAPAPR